MQNQQILDYLIIFILGIAFGLVVIKLFNVSNNRLKGLIVVGSILALYLFYFVVKTIDIYRDKIEINIIENLSSDTVEEEV